MRSSTPARFLQGEQLNQAAEGELPEFSPVVVLVKNATGGHLPALLGARHRRAGGQSAIAARTSSATRSCWSVSHANSSHCGRFVILKDDLARGSWAKR
jgi:hypothetical protein